jgi:elongation of very long chain fatty acids protein 4
MTTNSTYIPWIEFFKQKDWYYDLFIKYGDPRTQNSFLLKTPEPMLIIVLLYLAFVFIAPRIMESRRPFDLKKFIIVYNFMLVALSGYMCVEFLWTATLMGYSYTCQPIDWTYSTDALNMRMVSVSWLFFFSKIIELTDTIFFFLRKKNDQVTFLHVYHHSTMIINWWMAAKYVPVGQSFFVGVINSWIHTMMYVYYALAALGPEMQKYLWWKRYMTMMQLVQFVLVVTHTGWNKFVRTDCDFPWLFNTITFYYTWSMLFFFLNFYVQTYVFRKRQRKPKADGSGSAHDASLTNGVAPKEMSSSGDGLRNRKQAELNGNNNSRH